VYDLETGTRQPDLQTIHQLARALGVAFWALHEEPGTVLPGAVTLLAELYDIDAVIGDDPEAMVAVRTYLATQPADDAVTENLSRIAGRQDRFARAMRAAFPPR
jgi:transcriptional regulator with XRE-family HTH domain